jgi:hypothetical protein
MMRWVLALLVAVSLTGVAYVRTDGFSPGLIGGPLVAQPVGPLCAEAEQALSHPFHYLGKGRQCFVFASDDGRYVIKFFNQKYLRDPWYAFFLPGERSKRAARRHFYAHSYEIAFREFGEKILYLHLGPSERPLPALTLMDKAKQMHVFNLDPVPFVLQRRGIPFYEGLQAIYRQRGLDGLYREIDAFAEAVWRRIDKGIADADQDVEHNWGYIDGEIFHLDPGRLYYDAGLKDPRRRAQEWKSATRKFHKWLKREYPEAAHRIARWE